MVGTHRSLPSWKRGLKPVHAIRIIFPVRVASLVEAWIETPFMAMVNDQPTGSLPSWKRGLKQIAEYMIVMLGMSLPSWKRGLKPGITTSAVLSRAGRFPRGSVD